MLKIDNISKSFGGKVVLNNSSFSVKVGSITTLVGPNGCGKTTLFNIVSGLLEADSGKIIYDKKEIITKHPHKIARLGIVRTFQDPQLFKNLTVEEHLKLAIKDNSKLIENLFQRNKLSSDEKKIIEKTLKNLNLSHKKGSLSRDLSGGQRKLLDLAMVLVKDFDFILLDEPTAGVAPELRELISKIILKLKEQGKTVFIIEHDMNFVMKVSDEIIVLNEGKVLAKGKPNEIKNNEKVLEAYLGI